LLVLWLAQFTDVSYLTVTAAVQQHRNQLHVPMQLTDLLQFHGNAQHSCPVLTVTPVPPTFLADHCWSALLPIGTHCHLQAAPAFVLLARLTRCANDSNQLTGCSALHNHTRLLHENLHLHVTMMAAAVTCPTKSLQFRHAHHHGCF
jgi:hypothetical protein